MNPAIGVHKASGHSISDTVNGVSYVLARGDQDASTGKDHDGELVVQTKDIVVDFDLIELEVLQQVVPVPIHFETVELSNVLIKLMTSFLMLTL